jgi:F420-dependent oxidoreductase-like protein
MRFGVFVPQGWRLDLVGIPTDKHWATIVGVARELEELGCETAWVFDHFHTFPVPSQEVTYEAWTLMGALAVATERIRLGQMCTCNAYRPPAYLAKVAASVDVISNGRLEMGIGAGWYEHEFLGYGYGFGRPAERIGQLDEAVEILKRMWTEDEVHFEGEHYRLQGAICRPKPVQQPHIPLWVAGGGEQLTLRVAARHAAYTNFGDNLEQFVHKSQVLADHCRQVGTDFDRIVRSSNMTIICEQTEQAVEDRIAWMKDHYRPFVMPERLESLERFYRKMAGTPEQLVERLKPWVRTGLAYISAYFLETAYDLAGVRRFATEVIPEL